MVQAQEEQAKMLKEKENVSKLLTTSTASLDNRQSSTLSPIQSGNTSKPAQNVQFLLVGNQRIPINQTSPTTASSSVLSIKQAQTAAAALNHNAADSQLAQSTKIEPRNTHVTTLTPVAASKVSHLAPLLPASIPSGGVAIKPASPIGEATASTLSINQEGDVAQVSSGSSSNHQNTIILKVPSGLNAQFKGQLVKTPDQKLMLVTEVGGKKVGYLIGQNQHLPKHLFSSPLLPKISDTSSNAGQNPVQSVNQVAQSVAVPQTVTVNNIEDNPENSKDNIAKSQNDVVIVPDNVTSAPTTKKKKGKGRKRKGDSSEDETTPLAEVAASLKKTTINDDKASPEGGKGTKKGKKKGKKKDPNEPKK